MQDFFLSCSDCVLENPRSFYGNFALGPFKNSQSFTVASALRRTLLSEITCVVISHVEIDGVRHEYSTIDGVRESVLDILLNFKQIVLQNSSPLSKPLYGYLKVRGPGVLRASDFKLPPMIQCVDPDQYIATLNENGQLSLKFKIVDFQNALKTQSFLKNFSSNIHGDAFSTAYPFYGPDVFENHYSLTNQKKRKINSSPQQKKNQIDNDLKKKTKELWVDPILNPILKVNYLIETIEPIQFHVPNQVVRIELWTNGSIHPRKAFYEALSSLKNMFSKLEYMKFVNLENMQTLLNSEKTTRKVLKNFENDFQFSTLSEMKNIQTGFSRKKVFQEQIENLQKDYLVELNNQNFQNTPPFPLQSLNLPFRIFHCLQKHNFLNANDLLQYTPAQLKEFCGLSDFSIKFIQQKLKRFGLQLKSKEKAKNESL
jgi:DNA-directed RNA polymerase subunit alpha